MRSMQQALGIGFILFATTAAADPPDRSVRPEMRDGQETTVLMAASAGANASLRPAPRAEAPEIRAQARVSDPGFRRWIEGFRGRAQSAGISAATFDRAFRDVELNTRVLERDRNQSEFTRALWDYLDTAVSDSRVRNGREAVRDNRRTLQAIESAYRVEAEVVAAIWGLESAYGEVRGDTNIIEAMATLAYDGRRRRFFEAQLIAALRILQAGDVDARHMTGSWAGAMGHTQFMPTSFLDYAVDATGDGRRDIWSDNPADALASTANYLRRFGWTYGQPWGMEVVLPRGFDFSQTGERIKRDVSHWNAMGVRLPDGRPIPDHGRSSILLPAGAAGVALVIFDNFHVIERYNPADAYVIAVGHLSDRIGGGGPFQAGWPRGDRALSFDERQELQRRLTAAGFPPGAVDGIIGPNTIDAVRRYQASQGLIPDGYASLAILQRLR
ncbi:lytic murein transglycosylase [Rhodobacterales bacterium HKCCE3408]|nr:lytic murein transglycosylase [Rhodobacterales bacterium HKCCE3408]